MKPARPAKTAASKAPATPKRAALSAKTAVAAKRKTTAKPKAPRKASAPETHAKKSTPAAARKPAATQPPARAEKALPPAAPVKEETKPEAASKRAPAARADERGRRTKPPRQPAGRTVEPEVQPPPTVEAQAPPADAAAAPASEPQTDPGYRTAPKAAKRSSKKDDDDKALVKFDPLQRYLSEISRYRLLTRDEERSLGIRVMEQGDKDAAYVLVTANLRLVVKIALEFQRVWMQNLLDLIQEGNIGLMQAVKKFDPYKNVKFSYYASFWIKAYILKFIMDNWRLVKIGTTQGQRKLFFKLKKEKQRLIEQGFDPKPKLLSERLGVSEREIVDMDQRLDGWDVSLDAPVKNDSETERIEFVSTESESVEEQVSKKEIELLLHNKMGEFRKRMSPREIEIFELRIFSDNPVTLQEIGDRYGISRERVRQIEKNIIRKIREFFKSEIPDFASYSDSDSEDTSAE